MSSSVDADIRIVMTAEDRASDEVRSATQRINREYRDLQQQQRAVGRGFELQHRTTREVLGGLRTVGSLANTATNLYQRYNIMQLRVADANRDLKDSQEKLNDLTRAGKQGTDEWIRAKRQEEDAIRAVNQVKKEEILNNIGLVTSGLTTIGTLGRRGDLSKIAARVKNVGGRNLALGAAAATGGGLLGYAAGEYVTERMNEQLEAGTYGDVPKGLGRGIQGRRKFIQEQFNKQRNVTINVNSNDAGLSAQEVYNALDVYG